MRAPAVTSAPATPAGAPGHYREGAITERPPLGHLAAMRAVIGCAATTARLHTVRGWGHAAFCAESLLNTPLFVGFPGLVFTLWLAADQRGRYRGLYDWDGPRYAEAYARALWRVLALVSVPGSIHYTVLPGLRRDELLAPPQALAGPAPAQAATWWRPIEVS